MSRRLSASRLQLAGACLFPFREDVPWTDTGDVKPRRLGTGFHELTAAQVNGRIPAELEEDIAEEAWALFATWEAERWPSIQLGPTAEAEVTFALDPVNGTARLLGKDLGRDYSGALPGELVGTADLVQVDHPREFPRKPGEGASTMPGTPVVWITDWKTGRKRGSAEKNAQLRFLAAAAAKVYGAEQVYVSLCYVRPEGVEVDAHLFEAFELEVVIPSEVRALLEDAAKGDAEPSLGPHCDGLDDDLFCPARLACPAYRATIERDAPDAARHLPVLSEGGSLSASTAGAAVLALVKLEALVKGWWELAEAYVRANGPVDLGDGCEYREVETTRESIVVDERSTEAMREHFGDKYRSLIKQSVTKKALGELARELVGKGRPGAELERKVLASLRTEGAVRSKTTTSVQVVATKKTEAA